MLSVGMVTDVLRGELVSPKEVEVPCYVPLLCPIGQSELNMDYLLIILKSY